MGIYRMVLAIRGGLTLNNKLQMSACGATERLVTLTKQLKIGLCEQVRVN
jgi:hypothetical protein